MTRCAMAASRSIVVCAVDCGIVINPDMVVAQMEGGIGYGPSAALVWIDHGGTNGAVDQSNFHDHPVCGIQD